MAAVKFELGLHCCSHLIPKEGRDRLNKERERERKWQRVKLRQNGVGETEEHV